MSRAVQAPPPASQNGHGLADALALRKAQHEAHRRAVVAAYLAIPDVLLDSLERTATRLEPAAQFGALRLVVEIRRRRTKEREKAPA